MRLVKEKHQSAELCLQILSMVLLKDSPIAFDLGLDREFMEAVLGQERGIGLLKKLMQTLFCDEIVKPVVEQLLKLLYRWPQLNPPVLNDVIGALGCLTKN